MDKNKIVDQLNSYVQGIDEKFNVKNSIGDLDLLVEDDEFASFVDFEKTRFGIFGSDNQDGLIAQTGIIQKFYTKACELLERLNEKKYTIQTIKESDTSYLNLEDNKYFSFSDMKNTRSFKTYFTQKEIEELKQLQDVAIDWDKAIIKEVEG